MRKRSHHKWTRRTVSVILCASCFCTRPLQAADHEDTVQAAEHRLKELSLARDAAQKRAAELDAALTKARQELEQLRSRYAELYLKSHERQQQLEELKLQAAHLLVNRQALATDDTAGDALKALQDVRQQQVDLATQARSFKAYLSSVLDVLEPSDALRREIIGRSEELIDSAEQALKPMSRVAWRGNRDLTDRGCRVLALNDDLQIVVLDSGYAAGMRRGTAWRVVRDGETVARLRIIELRADISAAMVTDGRFSDIGPGTVVTPDRQSD